MGTPVFMSPSHNVNPVTYNVVLVMKSEDQNFETPFSAAVYEGIPTVLDL